MATAVSPRIADLRERVRAGALNRPGTYRMMAASGVVIYVGKSKRIRTRLMGYFRAKREEKAWRIVREAKAIEWEYSPNEFASLLRELELIKRFRPPYNVRSKRDGIYSFVKLTEGPAPTLQVVRRPTREPGTYFGPFVGGKRISEAIRELNDILRLRDCRQATPMRFADQRDLFGAEIAPLCPRYELHRCSAPCAALCTEQEYARRVQRARAFIAGEADGPLRELESRMADAAANLRYEHAASLRDRLSRLQMLRLEFLRLREMVDGLTFLYAVPGVADDHRVYAIRSGSLRGTYAAPRTAAERRRLLESAAVHYRDPEPATEIGSGRRVEEMLLIGQWFRTRPAERARTYPPSRWGELPLAASLGEQAVA